MTESRPLAAALWMTGTIASFTLMAVAGRAVSLDHDTFEILFYRSLIGIVLVLAFGGIARTLGEINRRALHIHGLRNLFHFAGQNLWLYALPLIPLAQLFALEFTAPLWVALLAPLVLAERLTRARLGAALLGFSGILIVVQPSAATLDPAMFAAAGSAIGFAGSALFTRKLTRTASITCILFWLAAMQAVMGFVCAGLDGRIALPAASALPWLCVIGATGMSAHFCLTRALSIAPASVVMPIDFTRLPVIALVGVAFYGEALQWGVLAGGAVIFAANWLNIRSETRAARAAAHPL